jgi:hypothetical protein
VLSLGVENAVVIQESFKFTQSGSILLVASQMFHRIEGMIHFPLLVVAPLDELGWSAWPESSFFYSLVSRVTSSAWAYLLVVVNIASDVLGFSWQAYGSGMGP